MPHITKPVPTHNHSHHELLLILGGNALSQTGDNILNIDENQCVFVPAKTIHSNYTTNSSAYIISLAFTFKKVKTTSKAQSLLTFFSKIFNQPTPLLIKNSKNILDNYNKIKSIFENIDMFSHFQIQTLLQEIILDLASNIQKQTKINFNIENFSYGKNLPFLINKSINSYLGTKSLTQIAKDLFVSKRQLERYIKKTFGTTFVERRTFLRIEAAKKLLTNSDASIEEIIDQVGFSNKSYFYKKFYEHTGFSPGDYRKSYHNE